MKKLILTVVCLSLVFSSFVSAQTSPSTNKLSLSKLTEVKKILVNQEELKLDVSAQVIDQTVYLPVRFISQKLGYQVAWNQEQQAIELSKENKRIVFHLDKNSYTYRELGANQAPGFESHVRLSQKPLLLNNRTLVPAEFFATLLGASIQKQDDTIHLSDQENNLTSGIITQIEPTKDGYMITIAPTAKSDITDHFVLNVSTADTMIHPNSLSIGDHIIAYTSLATTMSIPAQSAAYLIYSYKDYVPTIGAITDIKKNTIGILTGDIMQHFRLSPTAVQNFYINQMVIVYNTGVVATASPYYEFNYDKRYTNMGQPMIEVRGTVSAIGRDTFSVNTGDRTIVSSLNDHSVSLNQKVILTYVDMKDYNFTTSVLNQAYRYELIILKTERTEDGEMLLETKDKNGVLYNTVLRKSSLVNCNMTELIPGAKVVIYTDGRVATSEPAQINTLMIRLASAEVLK